jgi:type II secretory pathway pseudopilin PulG
MTLPEMMVATALLSLIAAVFLTLFASIQSRVLLEQTRSDTEDQARGAIEEMDREIRSGNLVYDPAAENPATYQLRVYTQANATTRNPYPQCVQWRIESDQLKRRSYQEINGSPSIIAAWRIVATGIVNRSLSPPVPAFSLDPNSSGRTVDIVLMANAKLSSSKSATVRIQTSDAIRNSSTGDPCTPIPAG